MSEGLSASLPKAYDPHSVEQRIYQRWLEGGYFTPRIDPSRKPFVIIMPPPNVTGSLHMGHALTATLEDLMVRWHRMMGEPTLWLPGVDHAGIATQVVVERELAKEGLTRHQLGRDAFLERVWRWVHKYRSRIREQHMRLGASCDWTRERFTLDPGPSRAVRTTFVNLYHKGLIYRGERIINWCVRCSTALSDLEVEHKQVQGELAYIRYPLEDGTGFVTVATTRPETMLGDTAVAVHPSDTRYTGLIGKRAVLPFLGRPLPIIADDAIDPSFGTGALKVTPAHDPVDWEIAQRHNLPAVSILHPDGTLNQEAGPFQGLERFQARRAVLQALRDQGLLEKVQPHTLALGHCQRCGTPVEPILSLQWFVRMAPLAEPAIRVVEEGTLRIIPEHYTKVYLNWLRNIKDWCISRQLWWGHRIPVWYCQDCGGQTCTLEDPSRCAHCGSGRLQQDPDVLDTWFSSGLWPHSTLGWPDDTADLRYFYPTSVMETGYDILFFWVARMVMLGIANTGKVPFYTVYLHGLVRDPYGLKMAKTRGNVVDPLDMVERYGCDALRFALTVGVAPGSDQRLSPHRLEAGRNFANKIWNAARLVFSTLEGATDLEGWSTPRPAHLEDRWILSRLQGVIQRVHRSMEEFLFGDAEQALHDFFWDEFCDWYLELSKVRLRRGMAPSPRPVLAYTLERLLRLLHPYMPFITEEVWQNLRRLLPREDNAPEMLIVAPWPCPEPALGDPRAEESMALVLSLIRTVRNARAEFRLEPRQPLEVFTAPGPYRPILEAEQEAVCALALAQPLHLLEDGQPLPSDRQCLRTAVGPVPIAIRIGNLVDLGKEVARLRAEADQAHLTLRRLQERLQDPHFRSRAPEEVVEREEERLRHTQARLDTLRSLLAQLIGSEG
ncbi:Valine--tRNA ligase [bacterium HR23]|nr:Valine--tRNA ligase [bacterium HR23]